MIFSGDLADKVLAGTKTQTRRPVKRDTKGIVPCRYIAGQTYAIQRKRGEHGVGPRIRVLSVTRVSSLAISYADTTAEGFDTPAQFFSRWQDFYGDAAPQCWRIEFELADGTTTAAVAASTKGARP